MKCIVCHLKFESTAPADFVVDGQSVCSAHVSTITFTRFSTKREARKRRQRIQGD